MTSSPVRPRRQPPGPPPERRGRARAALAALALAALLAVAVSRCAAHAPTPAPGPWADGTAHGRWLSVFDGHGTNTGDDDSLRLSPRAANGPDSTHAGLVVSTTTYTDVTFEARMRTVRQLREPAPNPWEVPWLVWAYSDPEHFYYVTLKPNGWELGKRDPVYEGGQRFLATGHGRYAVGDWHRVRVVQQGALISVAVDGRPLVSFTDTERPYLIGSAGAYTEDATVEFEGLRAR